MPNDNIVSALIDRLAPKYNLDPAAVKAVARGEGGLKWGAVGDQGTSYGPFQLHVGGALPQGRDAAWANSPAGLEYALRRMAESGSAGLRGPSAVEAIIRGFERPADPDSSVRNALARLGQAAPTMARGGVLSPAAAAPALTPAIAALLDSNNQLLGAPSSFSAFASLPTLADAPQPLQPAPPAATKAPKIRGAGVKFLIQFAAPYGLTVTSTTGGRHVKGSYHYKGKAVDFGGDTGRLSALAEAALRNPGQFAEMFYSGPGNPGFYIKGGKVYPLESLDRSVVDGHRTHVHIATR